MKEIPLTQGFVTIVDDAQYDRLAHHKYYYSRGYAVRMDVVDGKRKMLWMHREIMRTPEGMETDHINGDRLDNRVANLRICTTTQNQQNRKMKKNNSCGYKGVSWEKARNKWVAKIRHNAHTLHLGYFKNPRSAALAYDRAAREYFGEFARTNFP